MGDDTMVRAVSWSLVKLTPEIVFIEDDNRDGMSVTNAAEAVCRQCFADYGARRIVYKDSEGRWDELVHERGRFIRFAPFGGKHAH
jgi:hypothetical protein